jgi:hypothetical protein
MEIVSKSININIENICFIEEVTRRTPRRQKKRIEIRLDKTCPGIKHLETPELSNEEHISLPGPDSRLSMRKE